MPATPRLATSSVLSLLLLACAAPAAAPGADATAEPATATSGAEPGVSPAPATAPAPPAASAPAAGASPASEAMVALVAAEDRDAKDRETDARRAPAQLLTFTGVASGMRVADLGAGGGYTTELLVRAVGPEGKVWGQNNAFSIERFVKEPWAARLKKPINAAVVRVDSELDAPLPADATDLDLVTMIFYYHDAVVQGADVAAMNRAIFAALKPGGAYVIADHYARDGSDLEEWKKLHRITRERVVQDVQAAGFHLAAEGDFLRDPSDARDTPVWKQKFVTDRFVLKFVKPE